MNNMLFPTWTIEKEYKIIGKTMLRNKLRENKMFSYLYVTPHEVNMPILFNFLRTSFFIISLKTMK